MKRIIFFSFFILGGLILTTSCSKKPTVKPDYSVKLSSDTLTLQAGLTGQISSTNYSANQLTLSSSDTTVATIDNTGLITALKAGKITITVKSTEHGVSTPFNLTVTPGKFTDVGVGADGSVFLVGADLIPGTTGYRVYKYVNSELHKLPDCSAIRIAVSPQGVPWVINYQNQVLTYKAGTWQQQPGSATDIAIGANGAIFAVSTVVYSETGGFTVLRWNGTNWDTMTDCSAIHIAVDPNGIPWVANKTNSVYQYSGNVLWNAISGVFANDIGIGANGAVYVTGQNTGVAGYNPPIYHYDAGNWTQVGNDSGTSISIGTTGTIWWLDINGALHNQ